MYSLFNEQLKNLSFNGLVLLWYLALQKKAEKPISIFYPVDTDAYNTLPERVRKYFCQRNIHMRQSPTLLPKYEDSMSFSNVPEKN